MKFKLEPNRYNISDKELINDLKSVANKIGKLKLTISDYSKYGKYSQTTYINRFGSWKKSLELAKLDSKRKNAQLDNNEIIKDVQKVAKKLNKKSITTFDYTNYGKFSSSGAANKFGGWLNVLEKAGLEPSRKYKITKEEYFENLEIVWSSLGRQPKYSEIQKPLSKYSAGAYERKFGSWRKALEAFVIFINDDFQEENHQEELTKPIKPLEKENIFKHKTNRNISHRLRFLILKRDNFKCRICGKSPATDPKVILHVDHIKAWVKGGETVIENLQSLCSICNIGKSDLDL